MPRYRKEVAHGLGRPEALARLRAFSEKARGFSDLRGAWDENSYTFSVSVQGIRMSGTVLVEEEAIKLDGRLPLIAMPFAGWIPRIVNKGLARNVAPGQPPAQSVTQEDDLVAARAARGGGDAPPTVLFLHIPKAGGTTLGEFVYNQCGDESGGSEGELLSAGVLFLPYGFFKEPDLTVPEFVRSLLPRRDLRAVIGHFWFGLHEHLARPYTYITILRDPVERVVSLFHYLKLGEQMSLDAFAAAPPFKEVDNDQTRRLAGADPEIGRCTRAHLAAAKENLRRHFAAVGTTERFDETLVLLRRKLGWDREMLSYPRNVNAARPATVSLAPETVEKIRRLNELDFELWQFASQLLDETIEAEGDGFAEELDRYRSLTPA